MSIDKPSFLVDVELSNRLFDQADYFTSNSNRESGTITGAGQYLL